MLAQTRAFTKFLQEINKTEYHFAYGRACMLTHKCGILVC